jgi:DNA-binding GntR family transcriptional regulator
MNSILKEPANGSPTVTHTVYKSLLEGIVTGKIPPGTRLVHRKLAKEMGTSNIPIVAALHRLEGIGLLVNRPGEGSEVRRWDPKQYEESFLIRAALEGVAYRFFAMRATESDFEKLDECNAAYDAACEAGDWEASVLADRNLHLHIVRASRSEELIRMVENASLILLTIRSVLLPAELRKVGFAGEHNVLIEALKSRDPEVAEEKGRKHLLGSPVLKVLRRSLSDARAYQEAEYSALQ